MPAEAFLAWLPAPSAAVRLPSPRPAGDDRHDRLHAFRLRR